MDQQLLETNYIHCKEVSIRKLHFSHFDSRSPKMSFPTDKMTGHWLVVNVY